MSIDRSLKVGGGMTKHRNVLTRTERIAKLVERDKFSMDDGDPLGIPKVGNRKVVAGKSSKKAKKDEEEATPEAEA